MGKRYSLLLPAAVGCCSWLLHYLSGAYSGILKRGTAVAKHNLFS
jgi:hypothetical protein